MPLGTGARLAEGATKGTAYVHTTVFPDSRNLAEARFTARNSSLVRGIFHHCRGSHFSCGQLCQGTATATRTLPGCLHCMFFLCARTLHLPARTLPSFARLPACLSWQIPRACEHVRCLRGPLVRVCPALVCACLPCACACALSCIWSTYSIAVSFPTP